MKKNNVEKAIDNLPKMNILNNQVMSQKQNVKLGDMIKGRKEKMNQILQKMSASGAQTRTILENDKVSKLDVVSEVHSIYTEDPGNLSRQWRFQFRDANAVSRKEKLKVE